jgi:glycosyltransferase involved in cell wall biosynthesis
MKILWLIHDVLDPFYPFVDGKPTKGGSWIAPLFFNLAKSKDIELGVMTPIIDGKKIKKEIECITYYSIQIKKGDNDLPISRTLAERYLDAINDFQPDIIHIHGIEKNFGQLRKFVNMQIPIVCSIQGIINSYYPYLEESVSDITLKKFKSIKNYLGYGGFDSMAKSWKNYMPIEQEIVKINQYFIGRTSWDQTQLRVLNSEAKYYQGEELLRNVFYNKNWNLNQCIKHQVFISSSAYPIKGFHVVLKAIALLKKKYPDIQLVTPLFSINLNSSYWFDFIFANDYGRYLKSEILRLGLINHIRVFNRLTDEEMAECFIQANVFVLPSYIENSPNSLGEAMMIGTPTVVAPVGGVGSMLKDEDSTLMFTSGDSEYLASQIDRIFSNEILANQISISAKKTAIIRHCISSTINQYIDNYKNIIKLHNESNFHAVCET